MKTMLILNLALGLLAGHAYAADDAGKPCMKIKQACEAAGFTKGGHKEGKGLMMDCMKKLAQGESVAGVNISAEDMASCKEKHAEHKEKMEKRREKREERRANGPAKKGATEKVSDEAK